LDLIWYPLSSYVAANWWTDLEWTAGVVVQITVVVAAGNAKTDSCTIAPGNVNGTLNMAASDLSSKFQKDSPAGIHDGEHLLMRGP